MDRENSIEYKEMRTRSLYERVNIGLTIGCGLLLTASAIGMSVYVFRAAADQKRIEAGLGLSSQMQCEPTVHVQAQELYAQAKMSGATLTPPASVENCAQAAQLRAYSKTQIPHATTMIGRSSFLGVGASSAAMLALIGVTVKLRNRRLRELGVEPKESASIDALLRS
jgi:hypothetical protein